MRDRARNGRYAFVHERGRDFAAGIWVVDPAFMLDLVHEQLGEVETAPAREEAYFAGARIDDDELRDAAAEDEQRRAQARARHAEATRSNLGLGHDIRAGLIGPPRQPAPRATGSSSATCSSATTASRSPTAPAGPTPSGSARSATLAGTSRLRPTRSSTPSSSGALADPDPLRGIAQLAARWAAAFVLDPAGVTRTKALGSERIERKLRDALPGGESALRAAVWEFMRPMLSPALVELNRDAFVVNESAETTVDLDGHRAACDLDELALDDEPNADAA